MREELMYTSGEQETAEMENNSESLHLISVTEAMHLHDYKIMVKFSNGDTRLVDFTEKMQTAKGVFESLKDVENFKNFKVDGTIEWYNGADWAPDSLYLMGVHFD
jgi:hypothetical protein